MLNKDLIVKDLNNVKGNMQELQILVIIIRFIHSAIEKIKKTPEFTTPDDGKEGYYLGYMEICERFDAAREIVIKCNKLWIEESAKSKYGKVLKDGFLFVIGIIPVDNEIIEQIFKKDCIEYSDINEIFESTEFDAIYSLGIKPLLKDTADNSYDKILKHLNIDPACDADNPKAESLWGFCDEFCKPISE